MKFYLAILTLSISCFSCSYRVSPPDKFKYSLSDTLFFKVKDKKQKIDSAFIISNNNVIRATLNTGRYSILATEFYPGANILTITTVLKSGKEIEKESSLFVISDIVPKDYLIHEINELPHDTSAFTQGLVYHKGLLYESTGIKSKSRLRLINPKNGKCIKDTATDANLFNEGITIVNDTLYQLTWKDSLMIIRHLDFSIVKKVSLPAEGWGLCSNNGMLYLSDGSNRIIKMNPNTLDFVDTIRVVDNNGPVYYINEMEWIENHIWANIYGKDKIAVINPVSGKVIATVGIVNLIDRKVYTKAGVMNGIAYDYDLKKVYLTGKNWPFIKVCNSYFGE